MILELFDTSTELSPDHETVLNACFALGGLSALLLASVAIFWLQKMKAWHRACLTIALASVGFLSVFLVSSSTAKLIENHIDFPDGRTQTRSALLLINRAYRTQGKGTSWHIQTTPIWSDLDITERDYGFMVSHRRPGDDGHNPNEISSKSYFCAEVTLQESGNALRILNAGSRKLPPGTVVICPAH